MYVIGIEIKDEILSSAVLKVELFEYMFSRSKSYELILSIL